MNRRDSLLALASVTVVVSSAALSQARPRRIGLLLPNAARALSSAFRNRLSALGWTEGKNLVIETMNADDRNDRLPALAAELARRNVEVIVTSSTPGALAAKAATSSIPIVFAHVADPVRSKVVSNLARPGGNITGVANLAGDIALKQFELLKALMPRLERFAVLGDPSISAQNMFESIDAAAAKQGTTWVRLGAQTAAEIEAVFATAAHERATAIVVLPASVFLAQGRLIVSLARKYRIATAHQNRQAVVEGALVSYGIDFPDGFARTAVYVDKILKGAKPGDLPVEQVERFVSAVNRSTAESLGITIPASVLARVDEVIE
jgi:putative tryptophan/tyrosine transport system substrate-binding protein